MPFRKTVYCSERSTDVVQPRRLLKRLALRPGERVFHSVWICRCRCYCSVEINHVAPANRRRQPAFMRAVREQPMKCPQCIGPLTFLGFPPQSQFLEPWELVESQN
jgi:hypothetical protein